MSRKPTAASASHRSLVFEFKGTTTTSTEDYVEHLKIFLFHIPTGFAGTSLTFLARPDLTATARVLKDDAGNTISITVAAEQAVAVTDAVKALALASAGLLTIVSSTSETDKVIRGEGNR